MYRNRFIEKLRAKAEREDIILVVIGIMLTMVILVAIGSAFVVFLTSGPRT